MRRSFTITYEIIQHMDPEGLPMSELKTQFITINPSDIYNILKRKGLNRRLYRLFYG